MLTDRIHEGMTVFSSDGEKLGKVTACAGSSFTIEKGIFFPKDYVARADEIADVNDDEVRLALTKESFLRLREGYGGLTGAGMTESRSSGEKVFERDVVSRPVDEEEVEIRKRPVVKAEARLRDDRVTEQRAAEAEARGERVDVEGEGIAPRRLAPDDDDLLR